MPLPGCAWWHLILTNHATWLPGDPRGFRDHDHRVHSSGDYKHRPPAGEKAGLHDYAKRHAGPERIFTPEQRVWVGEALLNAIRGTERRCLTVAVGPSHSHVLIEADDNLSAAKALTGRLKRVSSYALRDRLPGQIWAQRGKPIRIRDREHQLNVFNYILDHAEKEGAWTWRFDRGEHGVLGEKR